MNKSRTNWMIYGCYGYSGKLLAEEAARRGLTPVLAGRDPEKTRAVAVELGLSYRVLGLDDRSALVKGLADMDLVVHCAGPFSATSAPMIDACIASRTHYLDITGEWEVFEHTHSQMVSGAARARQLLLCSGVGFDVVPTDCVARTLVEAMPEAVSLRLGFAGAADLSPGTAKTMVEGVSRPTKVRRDGKIVNAALKTCQIDYGEGPQQSLPFSWGDISSAFYTTRIPNITVYNPATDAQVMQSRIARLARPVLRMSAVQAYLKRKIGEKVVGPDAARRGRRGMKVWGEVTNVEGKKIQASLDTPSGYDLTKLAALAVVEHLLETTDHLVGSVTPSVLMGKNFVSRLPGCSEITIHH